MKKYYLLLLALFVFYAPANAVITGGRPNSFSGGNNAFAGIINPANAVWQADRFDIEGFWVHQKSSLTNHGNPFFPSGKTDLTYKTRDLFSVNFAVNKRLELNVCSKPYEASISFAAYRLPSYAKARTKMPLRALGTTPIYVLNKTEVISAFFSFKLNAVHSFGIGVDYLYFSHRRDGFQNSDNPLRSVSPGNVTNRGTDHSSGVGLSIGWRWVITENLAFGAACAKKSYCGQYRRYRGFEPRHAQNFTPLTIGGGFSYRITPKLAGRLEILWSNLGDLPGANNNVLSDGSPNLNKRGSKNSPGPGLQDATYINLGLGYKFNSMFSLGTGYSHRIKLSNTSNFLSHSYRRQTIFDTLALGAHFSYKKNELFLVFAHGFRNKVKGSVREAAGGGTFEGERQTNSLLISWGYLF